MANRTLETRTPELDRIREYQRWRRKNFPEVKKEDMFWAQGGKCAICKDTMPTVSAAHVDHNHETKKVRGLLCGRCNRGMGSFGDCTGVLRSAILYIEGQGTYCADESKKF